MYVPIRNGKLNSIRKLGVPAFYKIKSYLKIVPKHLQLVSYKVLLGNRAYYCFDNSRNFAKSF